MSETICVRENCASRITVIPPVTPSGTKFPDILIWEESTSGGAGMYRGKAALIFPTNWAGKVSAVSLPSEDSLFAELYKGHQVFRFMKEGGEYPHPLVFTIKTSQGNFTHTIGGTVVNPPTPNTGGTNKGKFNTSTSDGYRTLRLSALGSSFGHSIIFVYENGYAVTIPDTEKRFEIGSRSLIYRCGGKGLNSSSEKYTSHGGMGIWASTKLAGSSKYVTIFQVN